MEAMFEAGFVKLSMDMKQHVNLVVGYEYGK